MSVTQAGTTLEMPTLAELRRRQSVKWQTYASDVIPAWIAEMDFPVAQAIRERLDECVAASDFGYPQPAPRHLHERVGRWMHDDYGWSVEPDEVVVLPDVVRGVELALLCHTAPGDAVIVPTPSYPPLLAAVRDHGRVLVEAALVHGEQGWMVDEAALEKYFVQGATAIILSSPQNPTGKVFTVEELRTIVDLAAHHGAVVISDEIHAPLVFDPWRHVPTATVSSLARDVTVTVTSTSKAWNLPGLRCAVLIAQRPELLRPVLDLPVKMRKGSSIVGIEAAVAALDHGQSWLAAVKTVLVGNRDTVARFFAERWPTIPHTPPEATYLAWFDLNGMACGYDAAEHFLTEGKVALSDGQHFGKAGAGWLRLNFATTPAVLAEVLDGVDRALERACG